VSVYTKLSDAREKFHKLELKKTGHNKFANYYYFELGDFLIPALNVFKECGIIGIVSFGKEMASMTIVDLESGEKLVIESPMSTAALKGCHEVQNLGAVETYIRRYLWVDALEIVEHDALDATTGKKGDAPIVTPRGGIGDDLPDDVKQTLADYALYVTEQIEAGEVETAVKFLQDQNLESDQKVWLFNQLPSNIRSAIKKGK
jgi:hypothetical protein